MNPEDGRAESDNSWGHVDVSGLDVLASTKLLAGLTENQLKELGAVSKQRRYAPGEFILFEQDTDHTLYVIVEGVAQLAKQTSFNENQVRMLEFRAGDVLGELKVVDPQPNSASVIALTQVVAVAIDLEAFASSAALATVRSLVIENVGRILAERLRSTTRQSADALQRELQESRARSYAGRFMILMLAALAIYQLALTALELAPPRYHPPTSLLSFILIGWVLFPIVQSLRQTPFPLESYGLTTRNAGRVALQAVVWTLPVLLLMVLLKLVLMRWDPSVEAHPLFDPGAILIGPFSLWMYLFDVGLYVLHAPLQEIVARTGLQGTMQHFAPATAGHVNWKAIWISNLLFAAAHNYMGFGFCVAVFVPGMFWGWMFSRQRSIVGPIVSHLLIGIWAIFILGASVVIGGR